jgi:hypothetical protein
MGESDMIITDLKFPNEGDVDSALWFDAGGNYVTAYVDDNTIYSDFFDDDKKVVALAEWLFHFDFSSSGYTLDDLREALNHYSGQWFDRPMGVPDLAQYNEISFESLHIGQIKEVYEWESCKGETVCSELTPKDHGETVSEYKVYVGQHWVRTNDYADRQYDGPYKTKLEALQAAVSDYF